jgi:hypothetical protein
MQFRRALDRKNVTEALSAAGELQFVGLAEALELTLLLADERMRSTSAPPFAGTLALPTKRRTSTSAKASRVLALLTAIPANRLAASALAELFSRRRSLERCARRWLGGRVPPRGLAAPKSA